MQVRPPGSVHWVTMFQSTNDDRTDLKRRAGSHVPCDTVVPEILDQSNRRTVRECNTTDLCEVSTDLCRRVRILFVMSLRFAQRLKKTSDKDLPPPPLVR